MQINEIPDSLVQALAERDLHLALHTATTHLASLETSDIRDNSDAAQLQVLREYPHLVSALLTSITSHRQHLSHHPPKPEGHSIQAPARDFRR